MEKRIKKLLTMALCVLMALSFAGCKFTEEFKEGFDSAFTDETTATESPDDNKKPQSVNNEEAGGNKPLDTADAHPAHARSDVDPDSWLIYWYICGSDLESEHGFATNDLYELFDVELPDNVQVVIQTGGADKWQNKFVDSSSTCRYLYSGKDLYVLEKESSANMGDSQTLYDFLSYVDDNYDAAHKALIFWDHGGGSLSGAAFDENYEFDSLKLYELESVLKERYGTVSSVYDPWFDVIGFDACLMSTIDVANIVKDYAGYLVASEETEPGNGWYYTGLFKRLSANPSMDGAAFGRCICDSYYEGCEMVGTDGFATLSVTDMSKVPALLEAYDDYGNECLLKAVGDSDFLPRFYRCANVSENYGGNKEEEGYSDMVDIGSMAYNTMDMIPSSGKLISAINDAVIYKVQGKYRPEATGLSGYFAYDYNGERFSKYIDVGASLPHKYLFLYSLGGEVTPGMQEYLDDLDTKVEEALPPMMIYDTDWQGMQFKMAENSDVYGDVYVDLGPDAKNIIADYWPVFVYLDEATGDTLYLGDNKNYTTCDWENGIFTESFWGFWGSLDGVPVYMISMWNNEDYYLYAVPIYLNGNECHLQVVYSVTEDRYDILGVCDGIDDSGMARKGYRKIVAGDEIGIIWLGNNYETGEEEKVVRHTFIADDNLTFKDIFLPDGIYGMTFSLWDTYGNNCRTNIVMYEIMEGLLRTTIAKE